MEDFEDDFGDLYADVEAQASSAINGVPALFPFLSDSRDDTCPGEDGSESEDDLNILLNDEDCENQTLALEVRERAKREESCRESGDQECEDDSAAIKDQTGNGWTQDAWNQCKGSTSGYLWNSGSTQRRHGFSLPRFRSILDVNIDTFEEKPWNDPGVNTSDFFNFGLNEDTWKRYCNTVDQFRFSAITRQENPDDLSQIQPKGRAIQVKDIFYERQPTADERRPRDQDSDVVIQINLQDTPNAGEKLESTDCRKEEFSIESLEENDQTVDKCSIKENASTPIAGEKQVHDKDEKQQLDKKESAVINAFCDDLSMADSELSLGEEGQLSLVSSCFESDCEASRDRTNLNPGNVTCYDVKSSANSGSELWYSDASHRKIRRDNHTRVKPVERRNHSRCKTPISVENQHAIRRANNHRSDADYRHSRDRLSGNFGRWKNLAYYEEPELSNGYGGGREVAKHDGITWKSYSKERQYFRKEWDPYLREDRNTRTKHIDYNERFQPHRNNHYDISRKSTNTGSQFFNCKSTDADFVQERYGRSNGLIEQRSDRLSRRNAYRDYPHLEQEDLCSSDLNTEFWGNSNVELLKHQSDRSEDGYWENTDALFSSHQFLREADQERYKRLSSPGEEEQRNRFDYDDSYNFEDGFIFSNDLDHIRGRRFFGQESEVRPLTEDKLVNRDRKSRRDLFSRKSHRKEMRADLPGYKILRNRKTWQAISRAIKVSKNKNLQQFPDRRDSVDSFIENGEQLSGGRRNVRKLGFDRKTSYPGNVSCRLTDTNLDGSARCKSVRKTGRNKGKRFDGKRSFAVSDDYDLEIEEGQIIAENQPTWPAETATQDSGAGCVQIPSACDNRRILETLVKMEKRRERFREPIKMEQNKRPKPEVAPDGVDLPLAMQDRPSRKRRWLVS